MTNPVLSIIKSDLAEKWQQILSDLITDPKELLQILELDESESPFSLKALKQFPLKVPRPFVSKMKKGNWKDPLLRQIWPSTLEEEPHWKYKENPLQEEQYNPIPGLLHKYENRVLLTASPHCAVHCRYCFRRHFDYQANSPSRLQWQQSFDYIRQHNEIEEVILSGGDPLALGDKQLSWIMKELSSIPQLRSVRIHSRLPIVIPQRVTGKLIDALAVFRHKMVMVVHCNHPQELDQSSLTSLSTLAANGVTMLNQSVILKDVNDNSSDLTELSKVLFSANVLPYYLHMPDPVAGTAHFDVSEGQARQLIKQMQASLPGYLVPRLVREIPGEASKTLIPHI